MSPPDVPPGSEPDGAARLPAPRSPRGGGTTREPAGTGPCTADEPADRRAGEARTARLRADVRRQAAQEAARHAVSARDKALAKGDHVIELEARLLVRLERRR